MRSSKSAPPPTTPAASTDRTTISLIEAMTPMIRNGSATSSRFSTVVRTAKSSSTTMKTSSRTSSNSSIGAWEKSENTDQAVFPATASRISAATTSSSAMPA